MIQLKAAYTNDRLKGILNLHIYIFYNENEYLLYERKKFECVVSPLVVIYREKEIG